MKPSDPDPQSTAASVLDATALPRMLCVDDDPTVVRQLRILFRNQFDVTTATDPAEAIQLLSGARPFDVVISDQQMPKMLGVSLLERARELQPTAGRILLTGYCDNNAVLSAVNEANVDWYVSKPWDAEDIRGKAAQAARASVETRHAPQVVHKPEQDPPANHSVGTHDRSPSIEHGARSTVLLVGHHAPERVMVRSELSERCSVLFADTFEHAMIMFQRDHILPDVLVAAIDSNSEDQRLEIERLKTTLPAVVVIIVCDTSFTSAAIHLINHAKPFRFLAAPAGKRMLIRAIEAGIDRAIILRQNPALVEAQVPQQSLLPPSSPIILRWKILLSSLRGRWGFAR